MYIINKYVSYNNYEYIYNKSSLIGIYDSFEKAINDLKIILNKSKYGYDIDENNEIFVAKIFDNKKFIYYEIYYKKIKFNKIKLK
jgi:hypothetical protein